MAIAAADPAPAAVITRERGSGGLDTKGGGPAGAIDSGRGEANDEPVLDPNHLIRDRLPHWFGAAGDEPVEIVSLLSKQGEHSTSALHPAAKPRASDRRHATLVGRRRETRHLFASCQQVAT